MLVCPQCQFENPENHRFCQACGASLSHLDCPVCGTTVERSTEHCPECGTLTGQIWRVILLPTGEPSTLTASPPLTTGLMATMAGEFLDAQHRYQLRETVFIDELPPSGLEMTVLDQQPLEPSSLQAVKSAIFAADETSGGDPAAIAEAIAAQPIPAAAQPYLALETENFPALPQLHETWQIKDYALLLIEDRTQLPSLQERWSDEEVLPLQMVRWLHDLTKLWIALEPWQCQQSLLELKNLCVDEDQILCLRRLYPDAVEHPPTLQEFGKLWQKLFHHADRTVFASLAHLCLDLEGGRVTTIDELRSHLSAIADEFQPASIPELTSLEEVDIEASDFDDSAIVETLKQQHISSLTQVSASDPQDSNMDNKTPPPGLENVAFSSSAPVSPPEDMLLDTTPGLSIGDVNTELDDTAEGDDSPTVVLPMRLMSIEDSGYTDVGQQREHNEDFFSIDVDLKKGEIPGSRLLHAKGLYILCDGMGGHAGGEVASALAVETLRQYYKDHWGDQLPSEAQVREAVQLANKEIYDINQQNARLGSGRMGTTLVMVLVHDTQAIVAHVGDSRLYRLSRRLGLQQITVDHEVGQREIQRGVEPAIAYARPDAYQLTQALGPRDENFINPDVQFLELNEDCLLLLCSDGLSDNDLLETHWRTHLEPLLSSRSNLEQGVHQLIELANQYNGHDNITAIAIRVKVRPKVEQMKDAKRK